MFKHEKNLFHPVAVERPNPQYAALLQEQLGGGNGELKAAMQYMSQSFRIKDPEIKDLFLDIAAEELSHIEMVAQTINLLNGHDVDAQDADGREFVVIVTVEQRENAIIGVDTYDAVHSVSGRQKRSSQADYISSPQGVYPSMSASKISIADFLSAVNSTHQSILSEDVLEHLEETRDPDGYYSGRVRFSYAGENASNADLDALARAKEMQRSGVADETIRRQTGWFVGMDGKWRWEIDDSGMQYDRSGDLQGATTREWAKEDYTSALETFHDNASQKQMEKFRAHNRTMIAKDTQEQQRLAVELTEEMGDIFTDYLEAYGRYLKTNNNSPGGTLADYIDHPALFEAYPQLRKTRVRFTEGWGPGPNGEYDTETDTITLNASLRNAPEDTLIHEVQHAVQRAEGFATGASPEYWDQVQKTESAVGVNDKRIEHTQQRMLEILDGLPQNVAEQFREWRNLDTNSENAGEASRALAIASELDDGPYSDAFDEFFTLSWQLDQDMKYNYNRGGYDLYRNTAGEIEARDAAQRRTLSKEERQAKAPALGDDRTVFADEDGYGAAQTELDNEYGPQTDASFETVTAEETESNIRTVSGMETVASIEGTEFAKGEKDLITQVAEFFDSVGNSASNPRLGDVILDRKGVKSDLAHGIGRKKAAAFAAVPDVIQKGLVVDYQQNWKNRGYDTAVVAAPITIGGEPYYAAVILSRSDLTNRFYVHEIIAEKNGATPFKTGTREGNPSGNAPSIFDILDRIRNVKNESVTAEKYSADDSGQNAETEDNAWEKTGPAAELPGKALNVLRRAEWATVNRIGRALSVPYLAKRDSLRQNIREISNEYLEKGAISQETMDRVFKETYQKSVVLSREFYDQYKEIKDHLRTNPITLSERDQSDIADYKDFKKRSFGMRWPASESGTMRFTGR